MVHIGANSVTLVIPRAGGATKRIPIGGLLQLGEELLGELHEAVVLDVAIVAPALRPGHGLLVALRDDHFHTVDGGGDLLLIVDHGGLQGVEGIQGGLLTGDEVNAVELLNHALVQADADGLLGNVDGPVAAGVALVLGVIAQSAQQHLHEGIAGQGASGTERAVGITGDDALLGAVGDVAGEHVAHGHVLVGSGVRTQLSGGGGAKDQVADDLGSSATGQGVARLEGAVFVTVDNSHFGDHGDGFVISDVGVILELLGAGADSDQRHGHHQSQNQRKELLHGVSSFKIFAKRAGGRCPAGYGIGG